MTVRTICPQCGTPFTRTDNKARCTDCQPDREPGKPSKRELGYDWRWRTLSKRARELQPFCSDCGATEDLTTDHTPQAWARRRAGKVIRLCDVDVVCRRCNGERGAARGDRMTRLDGITADCPVCRTTLTPTSRGNVPAHRDTIGGPCPMSGHRWPRAELGA